MPRKKKKPNYDSNSIIEEYFKAVEDCLKKRNNSDNSLRSIADEFGISHLKVRKILITTGMYSTEKSRMIKELKEKGKSNIEIMRITGLSRASVNSYLPYTKIVYNAEELSTNAERIRKYRERQQILKRVETCITVNPEDVYDIVWQAITKFEGYPFYTDKNSKYSYTVNGEEVFIKNRKISINRESVNKALGIVMRTDMSATDQEMKVLEKYLLPIFKHFDLV